MTRASLLTVMCVGLACPAFAQSRYIPSDQPRLGTIEIDLGGVWSEGVSLGQSPADLTNNPSTATGSFVLFDTETRISRAAGFDGAVDFYLTRRLAAEGGVQISRPALSIRNMNDTEGAPAVTSTSSLTQYLITGSVVYHVGGTPAGRFQPFVAGGGGYLRQVLEGGSLLETGNEIHAGAGVRYWLGQSRRIGLRADVRVSLPSGGVTITDKRRTIAQIGAALAWRF
jgi:hypothetical protein